MIKYRVTIEVLDAEMVRDPGGTILAYDMWRPAYFQQFQNEHLDQVVSAVAVAVNSVVNKQQPIDK